MSTEGGGRGVGGLEVVDPRYVTLYERALSVLGDDPRVARVELSGSVATGTADEWSDLDLHVVARPEHYEALLAEWPAWLADITPTVFARTPIAPFIVNTVTADGLTFDLAIYSTETAPPRAEPAASLAPTQPASYVVGMMSTRRFPDIGEALEYAVLEQLRGLAGPFISLVQREEHLRHLTGVGHLLGLLTTVFLAETNAPPAGKHWNRTFTAEQRDAAAQLPPVRATREGILAFGLGIAELTLSRARSLYPRYGLTWPDELAAVTADRLRTVLGIDAGAWLY